MKNTLDIVALETWYQRYHRRLPFRESRHPYHIWVSEIMAQQTQMETVVSYFERFIDRFPTMADLARTDSDSLHQLVEGIGYYRRFQHMHEAAKLMVDAYQGVFPNTYEAVLSLPGVGAYTAGAIMSIAYNQPYSATDGNVIRVLARFYGIPDDMRMPKARTNISKLNQTLIEQATPHIYTQAMMELGALVCRPQKPSCDACPLQSSCIAFNQKITAELPFISRQKKPAIKRFITLILHYDDQIAIMKKEAGLLKGMYLYPQYENQTIKEVLDDLIRQGYMVDRVTPLKEYRHVFTHQVWLMSAYSIILSLLPSDHAFKWVQDLKSVPMAVAHRKINTQ